MRSAGITAKFNRMRELNYIDETIERDENPALRIGSVWRSALSTVYLMDCIEGMKQFPDKIFDLAVVDPPYGIGMDGGNVGYKGFNNFEKKDWDKEIPSNEYFAELFRVSKNQVIFGGNYFGLPPTRCYLVWDKGEGFYNRTYAECELAWTSFDANTCKIKYDPLAKGDYKGKIHPCQKPVTVYDWILQKYAKTNDLILDTHLGSGSSRIAANKACLDFVGFEIDREYYDNGNKRFKNFVSQGVLF
jgi:site-specific DNA-methyltransferase (adenine-specific)